MSDRFKFRVFDRETGKYLISFTSIYDEPNCEMELFYLDDNGSKYKTNIKKCILNGEEYTVENNLVNVEKRASCDSISKANVSVTNSNYKYGYKQYLEMIKNNSNCIFTPEIGEGKDIEDLFVREDKVKFFEKVKITDCHGNKQTKNKVSIEKLQNKIDRGSYCEETLNNFEHLFSKMGFKKLIN